MSLNRRLIRILPGIILLASFAIKASPQTAFAANPLLANVFQLDANAQYGGGACSADDWNRILTASPSVTGSTGILAQTACTPAGSLAATPILSARSFIFDGIGSNNGGCTPVTSTTCQDGLDSTFFTGGGSKDISPISSWGWTPTPSPSVPAKDDLTNAYAAGYNYQNHLILAFGSDRLANNGDANQSFWFFKGAVGPVAGGTFSGTHQIGDLLVQVGYSQGGAVGSVTVFKWNGTGLTQVGTGGACSASSTDVCAIANTSTTAALETNYTPKSSGPTGQYPTASFMEGAIDVTALNGGQPFCAASFFAETRSSTSSDAQLKDFAGGSFPLCSGNIQINPPTPTNEVGHPETFTVHVNQTTGSGTGAGANLPVTTTISNDSTGGPATFAQVNGNYGTCGTPVSPATTPPTATGTTNSSGDCTVIINSPKSGTVTVSASTSIPGVGTVSTDGTGSNSSPAVKTYVDAGISLSPLSASNEVSVHHTITATVKQNKGDGLGFVNAPDGTGVTFSFGSPNTAGATFVNNVSTCTTTNGSCSIQITTTSPGQVDVHATTTFTVGGVSLTRSTDGVGNLPNSIDAHKIYVDGNIALTPLSANNSVGSAHTITATVQQNDGLPANTNWDTFTGDGVTGFGPVPVGTLVTFSLLNNAAGASFVGGVNTCTTTTTAGLSSCSVQINSLTPGSVDIHATTTFSVLGVSLTRASGDGKSTDSANANKVYHAGEIKITKTVALGPITGQPVICFSLTKTDSGGTSSGGSMILAGASVTNPNEICAGPTPNVSGATNVNHDWSSSYTYDWTGLAAGYYVVKEVSASFPYSLNTLYTSTVQDLTGVATADATNDLGTVGNPLPPGSLDILKKVNGGALPANASFSFNVYHCSNTSSAAGVPGTCTGITPSTDPTGASPAGSAAIMVATLSTDGSGVGSCTLSSVGAAYSSSSCSVVLANGSGGLEVQINKLPEGWYQTYEQDLPAGSPYQIDTTNRTQTLAVQSGNDQTGGAGVPAATYNNQKLYRIIVLTCDMNNNLVQTGVQINPVTGQSLNTITSANGSGTTAASLCGLGGANFTGVSSNGNGLQPGSYSLNVNNLGS